MENEEENHGNRIRVRLRVRKVSFCCDRRGTACPGAVTQRDTSKRSLNVKYKII